MSYTKYVMPKKLTTEEFIIKAKIRHPDRNFDYSKMDYQGTFIPVIIICKRHGEFLQKQNNHLKCSSSRLKTTDEFIKESNLIYHNQFSYHKFVYISNHKPGLIICKIHGSFEQSPSWHLQGFGCPRCNVDRRAKNNIKTTDHFITKSQLVHKDTYEYDCTEYQGTKIKV